MHLSFHFVGTNSRKEIESGMKHDLVGPVLIEFLAILLLKKKKNSPNWHCFCVYNKTGSS